MGIIVKNIQICSLLNIYTNNTVDNITSLEAFIWILKINISLNQCIPGVLDLVLVLGQT